jgi:DNA-binding FadR family transcriptional regulator
MEFNKLMAPSLKELFIKELEGMILSGKLAIGEKLPPEREIAKTMQVSRGVVNCGILELARKGFLIIKPRVGTFISDYRRTGTLETLISILHYNGGMLRAGEIRSILEIRQALNTLALQLAIPQITEKDMETLRKYTDGIAKASSYREASEKAFEFHHELAVLSGNMLMPLVYYSFKDAVIMLWERFCTLHGVEKLYTNTDALCRYIEQRDIEGAVIWSDKTLKDAITGGDQIYY